MRAIAINVGANTNEPGFRGPVWPDGRFEYVPIPESEPTTERVPTYGDLDSHLDCPIPASVHETPVHLDPEFPEYPFCERYTYGDDSGVKAGPLLELTAGDYVFFYATLSVTGVGEADPEQSIATEGRDDSWLPPEWGAFIIGQFRLATDPLTGSAYESQYGAGSASETSDPFANNAHVKRDPFDGRVLLRGDPAESGLYETVVPLSTPEGGTEAGPLVTEASEDSGRGPWWRRPLRFDRAGTTRLLQASASEDVSTG